MNKFSNYKISFRLPYILNIAKIIYVCTANIVPVSNLAGCNDLNTMFCKFSETAKSAGETTAQLIIKRKEKGEK